MERRLDTTMGSMSPSSGLPPVVHHWHGNDQPQGQAPNFGGPTQPDTAGGTSITGGKKVELTELQESALQGFCGAMRRSGIPPVWSKILNASSLGEVRRFVLEAFEETRKALGIDKSDLTQFYLDDVWLKELQKLSFAPGGEILVFEWLMRGISILSLMNWTASDIFYENTENEIYSQTSNTRTEEQVRRYNAKEVREPPREWSKVKALFNTYCILLRALFTMYCEHFQTCWTLRNAIANMNGENEKHFNAERGYLCKLVVWHALTDSRQFFACELMPSAFDQANDFRSVLGRPVSHLTQVALDVSRLRIHSLEVMNFPSKWRGDDNSKKRFPNEQGGRSTGGPRDWKGAQYGDGFRGGNAFGGGGDKDHDRPTQPKGGHKHGPAPKAIYSKLERIIKDVKHKFQRVSLKEIVAASKMRYEDFPTLPGYKTKDGRSSICYVSLLGLCNFDEKTCYNTRVEEKDLTDEFVKKFVDTMGPALEAYVRGGQRNDSGYHGRSGRW